jgi:hypothetical protein
MTPPPPPPVLVVGGQPVTLASIGQRWGAAFLDNIIFWFTLGIGWLIWLWFASAEGQTPGKKIVGPRVVNQESGQLLLRGEAFGRGVLKAVYDVVAVLLFYIPWFIAAGMLFSDPLRRAPWDRMLRRSSSMHEGGHGGVPIPGPPAGDRRRGRRTSVEVPQRQCALPGLVRRGATTGGHRRMQDCSEGKSDPPVSGGEVIAPGETGGDDRRGRHSSKAVAQVPVNAASAANAQHDEGEDDAGKHNLQHSTPAIGDVGVGRAAARVGRQRSYGPSIFLLTSQPPVRRARGPGGTVPREPAAPGSPM